MARARSGGRESGGASGPALRRPAGPASAPGLHCVRRSGYVDRRIYKAGNPRAAAVPAGDQSAARTDSGAQVIFAAGLAVVVLRSGGITPHNGRRKQVRPWAS
jgi:hypothetical protein